MDAPGSQYTVSPGRVCPRNNSLKVEPIEATCDSHKFAEGHRFFD